jgi:hypothetical protein
MVEESNTPRIIHRPGSWFLDIVIQRREEQCRTNGTVRVQCGCEVFGNLFAEPSNAQGEQAGKHIVRFVGRIADA